MSLNDLVIGTAGWAWALGVSPAGVQHAPLPRVGNICEHGQHEFRKFRDARALLSVPTPYHTTRAAYILKVVAQNGTSRLSRRRLDSAARCCRPFH